MTRLAFLSAVEFCACARGERLPIDTSPGGTQGEMEPIEPGGATSAGGTPPKHTGGAPNIAGAYHGGAFNGDGGGPAAGSGGRNRPSGDGGSAAGGNDAESGGSGGVAGGSVSQGGAGSGGTDVGPIWGGSGSGGDDGQTTGDTGGTGSAGGDGEPRPRESPPLQVGRLSFSPAFCWVRKDGTASHFEWEEQRARYEAIISSWQGSSALRIDWRGLCRLDDPDRGGEVRILLDDRSERGATIEGCEESDRKGPWAIYPSESHRYAHCEWNMALPAFIDARSPILHTAGHALGFSHEHTAIVSPSNPCPTHSPSRPYSPYLTDYDPTSVMHPRSDERDAYFGNPWLQCGEVDDSSPRIVDELSPGDLLAMEMIYPLPDAPSFGSSSWIHSAGVRTYRDDYVVLMNDWTARGASVDWFRASYWSVTQTDGTVSIFGGPAALTAGPHSTSLQTAQIFTDPFGAYHFVTGTVALSTALHTAGVISAAY